MANMVTLTFFCFRVRQLVKVRYAAADGSQRPGATYPTLTKVAPRGVPRWPLSRFLGARYEFEMASTIQHRLLPATRPAAIVTNADMLVPIVLSCDSGQLWTCFGPLTARE